MQTLDYTNIGEHLITMRVSLVDHPELLDVVEISLDFKVTVTSSCPTAEIYFTDEIPVLIYEAGTEGYLYRSLISDSMSAADFASSALPCGPYKVEISGLGLSSTLTEPQILEIKIE